MSQKMEVIEFLDDTGNIMVKREPDTGDYEIKMGAQLIVRESQNAIFFRDGRALDIFGPGRHILQTQNLPILTKMITSIGYGPTSPFRAEVYFLNMKLFPNLKWGTREPILFKDSELNMIRIRSHGIFSIQIGDPTIFLNKVVGTKGLYFDMDIEDYLRRIIISKITDVFGKRFKTIFDMPKDFNELSLIVKSSLELDFETLGLYIHDFYINSISVPPMVQEMVDTRSGISAVGNIDRFMKYKAAMALDSAAQNPEGSASAGVGMGAGLGMGLMLPQMLKETMNVQESSGLSPFEKIKHLKELLDIGAISQEEFDTKKKYLLEVI